MLFSTWTDSPLSFTHLGLFRTKDLWLLVSNRKCDFPLSYCLRAQAKGEHATLAGTSLILSCPGLPTILFNAPRGRSVRDTQLLHDSLPFSGAWKTTQGIQWGGVKMAPYNLASFSHTEERYYCMMVTSQCLASAVPSLPVHAIVNGLYSKISTDIHGYYLGYFPMGAWSTQNNSGSVRYMSCS